MHKAYLLIGGNEGNRLSHLQQATAKITQFCGEIIGQSALYETAPWGITDQPRFFNQVLICQTKLEAERMMGILLGIEEAMGRRRLVKFGPRIIDIDILFFDRLIIERPGLQIPHPEIANRRFVLVPLCEVAPSFIHPQLQKTIQEILDSCADRLDVQKI